MKIEHVIKHLVLSIIFITKFINLFSQPAVNYQDDSVIKTKYTIIDSDSRSFNSFFESKSGQIRFDLVELENLSTNSTILGVEMNIKTNELKGSSTSIAFANIGNLWGVSSQVTYKNIQNKGYIFLDTNDLYIIISFLNGILEPQANLSIILLFIKFQ